LPHETVAEKGDLIGEREVMGIVKQVNFKLGASPFLQDPLPVWDRSLPVCFLVRPQQ
jgi:hypothetical protein